MISDATNGATNVAHRVGDEHVERDEGVASATRVAASGGGVSERRQQRRVVRQQDRRSMRR